jgi:hypothetical protein
MWYGLLADVVVFAHVAYIAYVVLGQVAIWLGLLLRRQWARSFWFRVTHLLAIAVVALEAAMGWTCPLTTWEDHFRVLAGQTARTGSFMVRLVHDLIFFNCEEWVFDTMHVATCALVLATFILWPPRRPAWLRRDSAAAGVRL